MNRIIKTIPVENGKLFAVMDSRRALLYECKAEIEIVEHSEHVPVLGKGSIITKREAVLLVTFEHRPKFEVNERTISGFSFCGDFLTTDGSIIGLEFDNMQLIDNLDLTSSGRCNFELRCSMEMLDKLRKL